MSGDHVLRLCESLPTGIPFKIFADNYFVSLPLVTKLRERGFHFTGTFRQNRIPINFESDKTLKAQGRGSSDYKVNEDGNMIAVKWFDNRSVHLISTYAGVEEPRQIQRYDRKSKEYVSITCPEIITEYNAFMGGIDLMDSLVSLYKYKFRSIRWPMFIWHHMTHLALVNAWLFYRREASQMGLPVSTANIHLGLFIMKSRYTYMFIETSCRLDGCENNIICPCLFFSYSPKFI